MSELKKVLRELPTYIKYTDDEIFQLFVLDNVDIKTNTVIFKVNMKLMLHNVRLPVFSLGQLLSEFLWYELPNPDRISISVNIEGNIIKIKFEETNYSVLNMSTPEDIIEYIESKNISCKYTKTDDEYIITFALTNIDLEDELKFSLELGLINTGYAMYTSMHQYLGAIKLWKLGKLKDECIQNHF